MKAKGQPYKIALFYHKVNSFKINDLQLLFSEKGVLP